MSITDELRKWGRATLADTSLLVRMEAIADRIDAEHEKAEDEWRAKNGDMWLKGYAACHEELMEGHPVIAADLENAGWVRKNKEHVISHATVEVTPHIDWSHMADELNEFVEIVRGMLIVGHSSTRTNGLKLRRTQMQFTDEQQRFIDEHYQLLPKDADGEYIHVGDVMEWVRYKDDDPTIVRTVSGIGNGVFFAWSDEQGRYAQYEAHAYRHHHAPTVEDVLTEFGIDWEYESDCEDRAALLKEYASKLQLKEDE